ncbi:hypothetical protein DTL21_11705 [Bremerella cremea]|uniref:Uncharacterized protein n=1 Tax=Blastopirellula marina TaxID=124 RepID=A0A2S8FPS5_9BACT|nr:hypothetical protein C5Y83_11700 [Blastopirellula marina]RCS46691.1 hypothetical protein DTL21_11705 [Bremerella cremea]
MEKFLFIGRLGEVSRLRGEEVNAIRRLEHGILPLGEVLHVDYDGVRSEPTTAILCFFLRMRDSFNDRSLN